MSDNKSDHSLNKIHLNDNKTDHSADKTHLYDNKIDHFADKFHTNDNTAYMAPYNPNTAGYKTHP